MAKAGHEPFLTSYLWDGGGIWAFIDAPTADHIRQRYDVLTVYENRPASITDEDYAFALKHAHFDLTDDAPSWLKAFMGED